MRKMSSGWCQNIMCESKGKKFEPPLLWDSKGVLEPINVDSRQ